MGSVGFEVQHAFDRRDCANPFPVGSSCYCFNSAVSGLSTLTLVHTCPTRANHRLCAVTSQVRAAIEITLYIQILTAMPAVQRVHS